MILEKNRKCWVRKDNNIRRIIKLINKIEDGLVVIFLVSILSIAIIQIILRNFFDSGLIWGDSLLSILVLWLGLSSAIVASRENKNINIDVFSAHVSEKYQLFIKKTGFIFAAIICLIISYYSYIFIYNEYLLNEMAFLKMPVWLTESIIPFAFFVMAIRYFLHSIISKTGCSK